MGTSVTLEVLRQHLEEMGWPHYQLKDEPGEREGLINTGYRDSEGKGHHIIIDPMVEKGALRIMAPGVVMVSTEETPETCLHELTLALAAINGKSVLAWWSYEPAIGAVSVQVSMPIDENDLSFEQFKRSMEAINWAIATYGAALQAVVDGAKKAKDVIDQDMPVPSEDDLALMRRLLAELEERARRARQPDDQGDAKPDGEDKPRGK